MLQVVALMRETYCRLASGTRPSVYIIVLYFSCKFVFLWTRFWEMACQTECGTVLWSMPRPVFYRASFMSTMPMISKILVSSSTTFSSSWDSLLMAHICLSTLSLKVRR